MKWIYYIVVFFAFTFIFSSVFFVSHVLAEEKKDERVSYSKHEIKMDVPLISDPYLKQVVTKKLDGFKNEFLKSIQGEQTEFTSTFFVTSKTYSYQNYFSIAFFLESYTGGAHPNHDIWTIVFDKEKKEVVFLHSILEENPKFLSSTSSFVRSSLLFHPGVVDTAWMMEGTRAESVNFERFLFTEEGILFYFIPYQIAPYSSGTFEVLMPYY